MNKFFTATSKKGVFYFFKGKILRNYILSALFICLFIFIPKLSHAEESITVQVSAQTPVGKTINRDTTNVNIASFDITNNDSITARVNVNSCNIRTVPYIGRDYAAGISTRIRSGNTVISENLNSLLCGSTGAPVYIDAGQTATIHIDISNSSQATNDQLDVYAEIDLIFASTSSSGNLTVHGLPVRGNTFIIPARGSSMPSVILSSPQSNETWRAGEEKTLHWTATNLPPEAHNQIAISLLKSDGSSIGPLFRITNANSGSGKITVPLLYPGNESYRLRLTLECTPQITACSVRSDSVNSVYIVGGSVPVTQPSITVLTPASTENWKAGESKVIRWTATNLPSAASDMVEINYIDTGRNDSVYTPFRVSNTGSTTIIVPALGGTGIYALRIKPACSTDSACAVYDDSSGVIKISKSESEGNNNNHNNNEPEHVTSEKLNVKKIDQALVNRSKGKIFLQVEDKGEAWYVAPTDGKKYYLANGASAYNALRKFGVGVTNQDLAKIPVGDSKYKSIDSDNDGLDDRTEQALGTDPNKNDSDGDGYSDKEEVYAGYNAKGAGKVKIDSGLVQKVKGKILLEVQGKGEAWYINPTDGKRYFLADANTAYEVMRKLSTGISNINLRKIGVGDLK